MSDRSRRVTAQAFARAGAPSSSDRKRRRQSASATSRTALSQSELKYRTLFETAGDAILLMRFDRFLDCNARALAIFGCTRDDLIGASPVTFSPAVQPDGRPSTEKALEKITLALEQGPQFFEWEHCRGGAPFPAEVSLNRLDLGDDVLLQAIVRDVTARRQAEDHVKELNETLARHAGELEQRVEARTAQLAQRNQELREFAYTVSHDLKAPLRGIAGYADELARRHRDGLDERGHFCVTQIVSAATNLDRLIENLLHYARVDTEIPAITEVNVRDLVDRVLRDRQLAILEHHAEVHVDIPFTTIRAWERGLTQIVTNLFDNALKYSRDARPARVRIAAALADGECRLSVSDNGIGFDMRYHDRIFGLFNRLVRMEEYEGTGAGLAIVRKVVDKQRGRVWATSAPGEGATFFVSLPVPPYSPGGSPAD